MPKNEQIYYNFSIRSTNKHEIDEIHSYCDKLQKRYGWNRPQALMYALKYLDKMTMEDKRDAD